MTFCEISYQKTQIILQTCTKLIHFDLDLHMGLVLHPSIVQWFYIRKKSNKNIYAIVDTNTIHALIITTLSLVYGHLLITSNP